MRGWKSSARFLRYTMSLKFIWSAPGVATELCRQGHHARQFGRPAQRFRHIRHAGQQGFAHPFRIQEARVAPEEARFLPIGETGRKGREGVGFGHETGDEDRIA